MDISSKIFIVGHNDLLENSLFRYFEERGFAGVQSASRLNLDVLNQVQVQEYFRDHAPDYVFLGSVRSGGIAANLKHPAEFIYANLQAQTNIIHAACAAGVRKLMYFAGSCAYPKDAAQPMKEDVLLTGPLEASSEPYSVAKIAGVKMCQAYRRQFGFKAIAVVPATLYGPGGETDPETAHVMGALIGKFQKAKAEGLPSVEVWGSGEARREFLHTDDFVSACAFLMSHYDGEGSLINVGSGEDVSIRELAEMIRDVSEYAGDIKFDHSKPEGAMRKLLDVSKIHALGWKATVGLREGIVGAITNRPDLDGASNV